ncbi:hypothetical protein [Halpernia sp. GG3]
MVDYVVNYNFIVKHLCENRGKPEMMCNGKCYLTKELLKTTDNSLKSGIVKINTFGFTDVFIVTEKFSFGNIFEFNSEKSRSQTLKVGDYNFNPFSKIFHPPLV